MIEKNSIVICQNFRRYFFYISRNFWNIEGYNKPCFLVSAPIYFFSNDFLFFLKAFFNLEFKLAVKFGSDDVLNSVFQAFRFSRSNLYSIFYSTYTKNSYFSYFFLFFFITELNKNFGESWNYTTNGGVDELDDEIKNKIRMNVIDNLTNASKFFYFFGFGFSTMVNLNEFVMFVEFINSNSFKISNNSYFSICFLRSFISKIFSSTTLFLIKKLLFKC